MKLCAGFYKLPEMLPDEFLLPGGYKITNCDNRVQDVKLRASTWEDPYYSGVMKEGEHVVVYLEEGTYLILGGEMEITPYVLEETE